MMKHLAHALLALSTCMILSAGLPGAAQGADRAEDTVFGLFENTCLNHAGHTQKVRDWASKTMKPLPLTEDDKRFASYVGRWGANLDGNAVVIRLLDTLWTCEVIAEGMDGPYMQEKLKTLGKSLEKTLEQKPGHKVRYLQRTPENQPDKRRNVLDIEMGNADTMIISATTRPGTGTARLSLTKSAGLVMQKPEDRYSKKGEKKMSRAAAVLTEQMETVLAYDIHDKDKVTVKAVRFFEEHCVEKFTDTDAIRAWADENMKPYENKAFENLHGMSITGNWVGEVAEDAFVELKLMDKPVSCIVTAMKSHALVTHNEIKLLSGRLGKDGAYETKYRGKMVNPKTGTTYSIIEMTPTGDQRPLRITVSTNTKSGTKSVFSIGYADE